MTKKTKSFWQEVKKGAPGEIAFLAGLIMIGSGALMVAAQGLGWM